ncbi:MAG: hypothetical protein CVT95_13020 [Bacteroidetes bacterium HGW-Bacteroidetes-12]|nr:MAG: hypothetical protein CVT95_13020 [Bacteroidetes bacterium HGW-Bacteroidetes-12]
MKKTLTLLLILFASTYLFSQSFEVTHETYGQLSNDAEYTVVGDTSVLKLETHLSIKNISGSSINSKVRKYLVSEVVGSTNDFCWGMCYPPNTYVSGIVPLATGDSAMFDGHYTSNKNIGTTVVRYTVFDNDSINDSLSVVVNYQVTSVGINMMEDIKFSDAYPNPANDYAYFNYSIPQGNSNASLVVFDLLGSVIIDKEITNHQGTLKINTYNLTNGVYFYSLITENQTIFTRKLIVNH